MKTNNYNAPTVKVVSFLVEEGFVGTLKDVGRFVETGSTSNKPGTELYETETTGWTGIYNNN